MPVPIHPDPNTTETCAVLADVDGDMPETSMDDGVWKVRCQGDERRTMVCLTVLRTHTPRRPVPLRCEGEQHWIEAIPFPAYDRNDDPRDGVLVLKGTKGTMFFVTDLPTADGTTSKGYCAVQQGVLILRTLRPLRKDSACRLTTDQGETFDVPIRVVDDIATLRADTTSPDL
jgi:hypothetical protein